VGDPRAHCQEGIRDCIRSDRLAFLTVALVPEGEDKHVGELCLLGRDVREGRTDGEFMTEVGPDSEDLVAGFVGFLCVSGVGDLESIAEVRVEVNSGDR
jgi:hypothetical protein